MQEDIFRCCHLMLILSCDEGLSGKLLSQIDYHLFIFCLVNELLNLFSRFLTSFIWTFLFCADSAYLDL